MSPADLEIIRSSRTWTGAARQLGMELTALRWAAKKAGVSVRPRYGGLRDDDASEWGGSKEARCKCGLLLPCDDCIPPAAEFMGRLANQGRASVTMPAVPERFTLEERRKMDQFAEARGKAWTNRQRRTK